MKPILFNTQMVEAILEGKKTVTRRVAKLPEYTERVSHDHENIFDCWTSTLSGVRCAEVKSPYQVGDIMYVRETFKLVPKTAYMYSTDVVQIPISEDEVCIYKAGWSRSNNGWKPSLHMPKEAARIFLKVTNVRVERLQDITPYGAWMEGCRIGKSFPWEKHILDLQNMCRDLVFNNLWNSTIKKQDLDKYGWEVNPWVWVIEFEKAEKPNETK